MADHEQIIEKTIADIKSGKVSSIRATANKYGIPRSTLQDRIKGKLSKHEARKHQQRLSPEQEEFLVDWILDQDPQGLSPSHERTRDMAHRILKMNKDTEPLGNE